MSEENQTVGVTALPKFDMPSYESEMTSKDVKSLALRHRIPLDLLPVVLRKGWTMDKLSDDMIGLYEQYFEFSGIRVPFSTFLLAVIKHFRVHISQIVPLGLNRLTMFELYCRSLGIVPSMNLFHVFYKVSKQGHWFSFEKRVGKGAGGQVFQETFSGLKGWKKRFFFLDRRAIPYAMAWRHHDSDVNDPVPEDGFQASDVQLLTEWVVDLRLVPSGLFFSQRVGYYVGFPWFSSLVTMSEYLRFPFLSGASISKGPPLTSKDRIEQHITHPLSSDQPIPEKTDHQKEVEVEDPKIVAIRERKAKAAAKKKKEKKRHGNDGGEGSRPKTKRRKTVARKDGPATSEATSSPEPIRIVNPNQANPSNVAAATAESREQRLPRDSAGHSVHNYSSQHDDERTDILRLGTSGCQSGRVLVDTTTEVTLMRVNKARGAKIHWGSLLTPLDIQHSAATQIWGCYKSSRGRAFYMPDWSIHRRCHLDTPEWCHELMVHLAPPTAQEESNALNNATALERAWFSLPRGALAQTEILERFEQLQASFDELAGTHAGCEDTVRQLLDARELSQLNSRLYLDVSERFRKFKNDHADCPDRIRLLEDRNNELSQVNNEKSLRIKELEDLFAKKDYALVYAERINSERAQEKEKLVTQLGKTEMEKFDSMRKLLPTVVERLFQSHEYKRSLSEPFNLAIQAGWGKGLT
ncbi:hypothetical protein Tco_0663535 [Tanacetum coccineum]